MPIPAELPQRLSEILRLREGVGTTEIIHTQLGSVGYKNVDSDRKLIFVDGESTIDTTYGNVLIAILDNAVLTMTGNISPTTKFLAFNNSELHFPTTLSKSVENALKNGQIEIFDNAKLVTKDFTATFAYAAQLCTYTTPSNTWHPANSSTASISRAIGSPLTNAQIIALSESSDDAPDISKREMVNNKTTREIAEAMIIADAQSRTMSRGLS